MIFTEELLLSYVLNFIASITLLLSFRWCRDYVPFSVTVSIASVLSLLLEIRTIHNSYSVEVVLAIFRSLFIAVPLALALEFMPFAGRLIDIVRGMLFAEINFGQNNSRNSILENMFDLLVVVLFLKQDLFFVLLEKFFLISNLNQSALSIVEISSCALNAGLLIASPVLALCFSIELTSIILSKAMPRINLDLTAAKALIGMLAVYFGINYYSTNFIQWLSFYLLPSVS